MRFISNQQNFGLPLAGIGRSMARRLDTAFTKLNPGPTEGLRTHG